MLKKLSVILFLALLVLSSIAVAKNVVEHQGLNNRAVLSPGTLVFKNEVGPTNQVYAPAPKFGTYSTAQTFAPSRQVMDDYTTQRDMWHNTAMGRQIAWGGYYNAACDYVYIDWPTNSPALVVFGAFFDWPLGDWYTDIGVVPVAPNDTYYPNMGVNPKTGNPVSSYHNSTGTDVYSGASTALCGTGLSTWTGSLTPGPPNLEGINTGDCGDQDAELTPYIWPHMDVDTNSSGQQVIHLAANESSDESCVNPDAGAIETSSLVYYRKVADGAWEGPHFMDSAYLISQIVVADKNGPNVYYCYPKPVYYQNGPNPHPCDNGAAPGYYQHTQDIAYRLSTNDGQSWGPVTKVTDYAEGFEQGLTDPARYDLTAMVDTVGNLHMVWWSNDWFKDKDDADVCGTNSGFYFVGKLWHYDTGNDCISVAYDASHPHSFFGGDPNTGGGERLGVFRTVCTKPNISWCDDKLYISFERYGAHPVGDSSKELGLGSAQDDTLMQVADILVVGSDASGNMGQTWTSAINLTNTESTNCAPGDCFSEVWPTMAMYSHDSLMISYLEDKDPGQWYNRAEGIQTDNPVMFMTWPCFTMADVGSNPKLSTDPGEPIYREIALAPLGNTAGCTTPDTFTANLVLSNTGNVALDYTTTANETWLTVTDEGPGTVTAGTGPSNSDAAGWDGASGCASPATITWQASSSGLTAGNYSGTITIGVPPLDDIEIEVHLVVACDYYLPEYATLSSGCWTVDTWNTPQAANGSQHQALGNMNFYTCGDSIAPMYTEALIVGWKVGSDIYCYTDNSDTHMGDLLPAGLPYWQSLNARMRAITTTTVDSVGTPGSGVGFVRSTGYWCTPDSVVFGKTEYMVPGHRDTAVLIEKVTLWNESGTALNNFLVGEGIDWDVRQDSNKDQSGVDLSRKLVYQYGSGPDVNTYAGLAPLESDSIENDVDLIDYAATVLGNETWIYPDTGYNIIDIYNYLSTLSGITPFAHSDSLTDLNSVFRFYRGTLGATDTLVFWKIKTATQDGSTALGELFDKGTEFADKYFIQRCQGMCGDANNDQSVDISDAVTIINFVFIGGDPPAPIQACGDANTDASVDISDAVTIINFVFIGGDPPEDCSPGAWGSQGGDCCPFTGK